MSIGNKGFHQEEPVMAFYREAKEKGISESDLPTINPRLVSWTATEMLAGRSGICTQH